MSIIPKTKIEIRRSVLEAIRRLQMDGHIINSGLLRSPSEGGRLQVVWKAAKCEDKAI